ncbi:MAG TPA: hypothetical protein VMV10_18950 [Pirellulales bacterium]|nr:hypothetical protein [Pirellulales bacterium]
MQTNASAAAPRRRIGLGTIVLLSCGGLLLLVVLAAVAFKISGRRALNAELAKIRAAGEPASAAELEAYYQSPPADRDTTQLWLEAIAPLETPQFQSDAQALPIVGEEPGEIPLPGEPWPQLEAAEQLLSKYGRSLELMHQAARQGGRARFPTRFADGIAMDLSHVTKLRAGGRLLGLESAVEAHRGRPDAAVEAIETMFAAARSLEQEPSIISQAVRMGLGSFAGERAAWLLSADVLNDAHLARLDAELSAIDYGRPLRRGLLGERVQGIELFANPAMFNEENDKRIDALIAMGGDGDETMYLELMGELIAAADQSPLARKRAAAYVNAQLDQLAGSRLAAVSHLRTALLVPPSSALIESINRYEAGRDATRAAVAFERFRLANGRLPEKFEELTSKLLDAVPIDPFDGGPLRYRVEASEYVIYSVGKDGTDQQGRSEPPDQADDIAVRVRYRQAPANSSAPRE